MMHLYLYNNFSILFDRKYHAAHLLANVKNKAVIVLVKQILRMYINYVKNFGESWVFLYEGQFGRIVLRHC